MKGGNGDDDDHNRRQRFEPMKGEHIIYGSPSPSLVEHSHDDGDNLTHPLSVGGSSHHQDQQHRPRQDVAIVDSTPAARSRNARQTAADNASDQQRLIPIQQQRLMVIWGVTSVTSMVVFTIIVLPTMALVSLVVGLASAGLLAHTTATVLQQDVTPSRTLIWALQNNMLPGWLHRALMETSLHEWLAPNPDMDWNYLINEMRYLLVYILPLDANRLDQLVNQLPPRHRRRLQQPGFLGRMLLGNRLPQDDSYSDVPSTIPTPVIVQQQQRHIHHHTHVIDNPGGLTAATGTPTTVATTGASRRRLDRDDDSIDSDLGLDISPNDMAGGLSDQQATRFTSSIGIAPLVDENNNTTADTSAPNNLTGSDTNIRRAAVGGTEEGPTPASAVATTNIHDGEQFLQQLLQQDDDFNSTIFSAGAGSLMQEDEWSIEERLLSDAVMSIVYSFCFPFFQPWSERVLNNWLRPASRWLWRVGTSTLMAASGLGALGYYRYNFTSYQRIGGGGIYRYNTNVGLSSSRGLVSVLFGNLDSGRITTQITSPNVIWSTALLGAGLMGVSYATSMFVGWSNAQLQQTHQARRRRSLSMNFASQAFYDKIRQANDDDNTKHNNDGNSKHKKK